MGDLMSREEAIKIIERARVVVLGNSEYNKAMSMAIEALKAEPVKHGRWVLGRNGDYYCSECDRMMLGVYAGTKFENVQPYWCGYCGAKMDK